MANNDPGTSVHFRLQIDNINLGDWNTCDGLGCEVEVEQYHEGGNNEFIWQLPSHLRYSNVTLTRPLTRDTTKVATYLAILTSKASWR
jgi:phage tail-like protein